MGLTRAEDLCQEVPVKHNADDKDHRDNRNHGAGKDDIALLPALLVLKLLPCSRILETLRLLLPGEGWLWLGAKCVLFTLIFLPYCWLVLLDEEEKKHIKLISSHAYGIRYFYDALGEFRICILIPRGVQLPYSAETFSFTRRLNQYESVFTVFELDTYADKDELIPEAEGREIMSIALTRTKDHEIPVHTETIETLTLSEAELLSMKAVDHINGVSVEDTVSIKRK